MFKSCVRPIIGFIFSQGFYSCSRSDDKKHSEIIFLGSGSSAGNPHPYYVLNPTMNKSSDMALVGNPRYNKNYRCNPSILVKYSKDRDESTKDSKNIIIDVGKTFRETLIRWFPEFGINSVDAIVLTHGHADAIFGLDDVRSVQQKDVSTPVYLSEDCLNIVKKVFFYLFPKDTPSTSVAVFRPVSAVEWNIVKYFEPFHAAGLEMTPLPGIRPFVDFLIILSTLH